MQATATVLLPTGSPKSARVVALATFFHRSFNRSFPAVFAFDWSWACAATRQSGSGAAPQSDAQSSGPGPVHATHEGSHAEQTASLLAVHMAVSKKPGPQVEHVSHVAPPVMSWNVPAVQLVHVVCPAAPWNVPAAQSLHVLWPARAANVPGPQLGQVL
jgi:hypothetical protein